MLRSAAVLALILTSATLHAATYTVSTTADSGTGSLRQAILDANANAGADTIAFAIGTGAQTITLASDLPAVTGPVTIDGTTQPGYSGTPLVTIASQHTGTFTISAGSSTVRGLAFAGTRVLLQTGNDNVFAGNSVASATGRCGVEITSSNNRIGGTTATDANKFDGNNGIGVCLTGGAATNNTVKGNRIVGNVISGVKVEGSANLIGGTEAGARNLISGNGGAGIDLGGTQNRIEGNYIGVDSGGAGPFPNGTRFAAGDRANIKVSGTGHTIGGLSFARRNIIAWGTPGIAFVSPSTQNVAILSNGMFGNSKDIDLTNTPLQRLPNDPLDLDTGANGLQNHPQICNVVQMSLNTVMISGWLRSRPNATYTIQIFSSNPSRMSTCDSDTIVATFPVTTDANGDATFTGTYPGLWYVSYAATATDANNNTSEVSPCDLCAPVSDFDGDGRSDIFWRNTVTGENTFWFMDGTKIRWGGNPLSAGPEWTPYLADFDGSGTTDIFWRNRTTGENGLWYMENVRIVQGGGNIPPMAPEWEPLFGDFTGDRRADVLWRNATTGAQELWAARGYPAFEVAGAGPATAAGGWERRAGFINDDSFTDVFWRHPASGENSLSFMNGRTVVGGANLPPIPDDWTASFGDSNGDGRADILWRNKNTGELTFWFLSGGTIIGGGNLWPVGAPWQLIRGDYDGNSRLDILWRSPASGENTVWLLDGRSIIGGGNLPAVTAAGWVVISQQ